MTHRHQPIRKNIFILFMILPSLTTFGQITTERLNDTISYIHDHYAKRIALFEKEPVATGKIIFLGNSITEEGQWGKLTGDNTVINRGISGDITDGVLKRLADVIQR